MKDVIVALDFKDKETCLEFLDKFNESIYVKVGMELFYKEGPEIIKLIKNRGHKIFLDLKLHDIPNTVGGAFRSLSSLNVDMLNLHIAGGSEMIKRAKEELPSTTLLGVTMLTSIDERAMHDEILINSRLSVEQVVLSYARLGKESGLDGIVCSAQEVPKVKEELGPEFLTITPGIRPQGEDTGDQKRVVTPEDARNLGSDYIVCGRPITKSDDPVLSYKKIREEFLGIWKK